MLSRIIDTAWALWVLLASWRAYRRGYDAGWEAHHEMVMDEVEQRIQDRTAQIQRRHPGHSS